MNDVVPASPASYEMYLLSRFRLIAQTGYLTLKSCDEHGLYRLDYPNAEVKEALLEYLISDLRFEQISLNTPLKV